MASKKDRMADELVAVFTDPIISYPTPWNQEIPVWIRQAIMIERLVAARAFIKNGTQITGTDAEVLAYIMPRSQEAPLDGEWTNILIHVAGKVYKEKNGKPFPEDLEVRELCRYEEDLLTRLRHWIYEKRLKYRAELRRQERTNGKKNAPASVDQLRLQFEELEPTKQNV
jgi:hypothetical protein